ANRCTPGFSCDRSAGSSLTTFASGGTTTDFSPSLYFSVSLLPATLATVAFVIVLGDFPPAAPTPVTVALVIVLPGRRSHGRWPSPVPRIDSGNRCTSIARSVPSGWATAVVPMKAPSRRAAARRPDHPLGQRPVARDHGGERVADPRRLSRDGPEGRSRGLVSASGLDASGVDACR